jgi:hypothetical protein
MKNLYWLGIVSAALLAVAPVQAASKPALEGTSMLSCAGLPCVDVTLQNGKHLRMLVGLGDEATIVDAAAAKTAGLDNADGTVTLAGVSLGKASLGDVKAQAENLVQKIEKKQMPPADGILGYNAFHDRLVQLDYRHQQVRVSGPLTADVKCPDFCGDTHTVDFAKDDPPVLVTTGFSVDGKPMTAKIDPLYTGTILIYTAAVPKLDLQTASGVNATEFFPYTDGGVAMREGRAKLESFGSKSMARNAALFFAVPQMQAPAAGIDGTVGAGLLTGHVVYVDFHSHHFWMS